MIVLQFAWGGGPTNTHLPHNIYENSVVYPGGCIFFPGVPGNLAGEFLGSPQDPLMHTQARMIIRR